MDFSFRASFAHIILKLCTVEHAIWLIWDIRHPKSLIRRLVLYGWSGSCVWHSTNQKTCVFLFQILNQASNSNVCALASVQLSLDGLESGIRCQLFRKSCRLGTLAIFEWQKCLFQSFHMEMPFQSCHISVDGTNVLFLTSVLIFHALGLAALG